MALRSKKEILRELQTIPGVGKSISEDLYNIEVYSVADLKGKEPEMLYEVLCMKAGQHLDRCLLYVMRCAVYYASTPFGKQKSQMLKWWNWKDTK